MLGTKIEPISILSSSSTSQSQSNATNSSSRRANDSPNSMITTTPIQSHPQPSPTSSPKRESSPTRSRVNGNSPLPTSSNEPPPPTSPLSRMSHGFARRISRSSIPNESNSYLDDGGGVVSRGLLPVTRQERERDKMMRQLSQLGYQAGAANQGRTVESESLPDNIVSMAGLNEALQSLQPREEEEEVAGGSGDQTPPSYPLPPNSIDGTGPKFPSLRKLSSGNPINLRKLSLPSLRTGNGSGSGDRNPVSKESQPANKPSSSSPTTTSNSTFNPNNRRRSSSTFFSGLTSKGSNGNSGTQEGTQASNHLTSSPPSSQPPTFTNPFASSSFSSPKNPSTNIKSDPNTTPRKTSIPSTSIANSSHTASSPVQYQQAPSTPSSITSRPSARVSFDFAGTNEAIRTSHSRRPSASLVNLPLASTIIGNQSNSSNPTSQIIPGQPFLEDEEVENMEATRPSLEDVSSSQRGSQQSIRGLRDSMRGFGSQSSEGLGLRRSTDVRPELDGIASSRPSTDSRRGRFSAFLKGRREGESEPQEELVAPNASTSTPSTPSRLSFSAFRASRASGESVRRSRKNSIAERPISGAGPSEPRSSQDPSRISAEIDPNQGAGTGRKRKVSGFLKKVGLVGKKERNVSGGSSHFQNSPPLPQSPALNQHLGGGSSQVETRDDDESELASNPDAAFERAFGKPTQGTLRSPKSTNSLNRIGGDSNVGNETIASRHSRNSSNSSGLRNEFSPFPISTATAPRPLAQVQGSEMSTSQSIVSGDGASFHSTTSSPSTSIIPPSSEPPTYSSRTNGLPSSSSRPFEWVDSFGLASGDHRSSGIGKPATSPSDSASGTDHTNTSRATSAGLPSGSQPRSSDLAREVPSTHPTSSKGKERESNVSSGENRNDLGAPPPSDDGRRSVGLDEEQDRQDRTITNLPASSPLPPSSSSFSTPATDAGSNGVPERPYRAAGLSHMPRLHSMKGASGGGKGGSGNGRSPGGGSSGGAGDGRDDDEAHDSGGGAGDDSEDVTDEEDEDHNAEDSRVAMDDMETDTENEGEGEEEEAERQRARAIVAASMPMPGGFGGFGLTSSPSTSLANSQELSRENRPRPEEISLPPRPSFTSQNPPSELGNRATPGPASTPQQVVGKQAWTSFSSTPFESPFTAINETPKANGVGMTSEPSYFSHQPAPARNAGSSAYVGGDAPPPSPSVITRSRAPSSASGRSYGQPPSRSMTTPAREIPPMPPASLADLNFASKERGRSSAAQSSASGLESGTSSRSRTKSGTKDVSTRARPSTAGDSLPAMAAQGSQPPALPEKNQQAERRQPSLAPAFGFSPLGATSDRPGLYHLKSKSLIDLSSPAERMHDGAALSPTASMKKSGGKNGLLLPGISISQPDGSKTGEKRDPEYEAPPMSPSLRRRSMIELRVEPPPYTVIHRRPEGPQVIYPREEEGQEKLPLYNCSVHIEGYLPRKMEFSAPGVQAKDRSWKRQYIVLHGTCLRVYKTDAIAGLASQGAWGNMKGVHVHLEPMNEDGPGSTSSTVPGQSPFLTQPNQSRSHHPSPNANSGSSSPSSHEKGASHSGPELAAAKEVLTSVAHAPHPNRPGHSAAVSAEAKTHHGLVRNYTLQSAESGLAADYLKRRHVVRVRAEGEQFLLHTRSDRHVVDWIEALQASTNVSMDLEKRQMPKFITLPRRRRRRRRNPDEPANAADAEARDLAEAQRRSLADTMGGGRSSNRRDRSNRSNGDDGQTPSAAFDERLDEMLREEHADLNSRNGADI